MVGKIGHTKDDSRTVAVMKPHEYVPTLKAVDREAYKVTIKPDEEETIVWVSTRKTYTSRMDKSWKQLLTYAGKV